MNEKISKKADPYTGVLFYCEYNECIDKQATMLKVILEQNNETIKTISTRTQILTCPHSLVGYCGWIVNLLDQLRRHGLLS